MPHGWPAVLAGTVAVFFSMTGAEIVIDLSLMPDLWLASDQLDPALVVDCANARVSTITDATGTARFTILGGSHGALAVSPMNMGRIYANGTLLAAPTVAAYDLDGAGGLGANDLSLWITDFGSTLNWGRSDYDCSGSIGVNDFSLMLTAYGSTLMPQSGASVCP